MTPRRTIRVLAALLAACPAWGAFSYKRSITVDHTKCGSSDSSNFAVYVYISDATFKTTGNGGHVNSSTGDDILFYSDSAGTTQIASEIDGYDATNGVLHAWVKVGTLSSSSDTVIYVFYGNSSPPARTTNPWNSNYQGVWHMGSSSSSFSASDSTSNANNLTNSSVTATSGKINGAGSYNGSTAYLSISSPPSGLKPTNLTVSGWFYYSSLSTYYLVSMGASGSAPAPYSFYSSGSVLYGYINNFGGYASRTPSSGTWLHLVMTVNPSGSVTVYKDGASATGTGGDDRLYRSEPVHHRSVNSSGLVFFRVHRRSPGNERRGQHVVGHQ